MNALWIATANDKKRLELERMLAGLGYEIRTIADLPEPIDIVEDGETFAANAAIKACTLARLVGAPAIGDDSGLCVDALDGRPGVRSARYAGPGATDSDRIAKLLGELDGQSNRAGRFVCNICLANADGTVITTFEESCHGTIADAPCGDGGFGYDPVFLPTDLADRDPNQSFAQLTPDEKDSMSHRGRALRRLVEHLTAHPIAP